MAFDPPRCPNESCPRHLEPEGIFYWRMGFYLPKCRTEPVPRFRCRSCRTGFSKQTFCADYRDRRPECNESVLRDLCSGVGLRQAGRAFRPHLGIRSVLGKLKKFGRTMALLHDNVCRNLPSGRTFLFDEEETFEGRSIRPLTMPVLIEKETWFVVATAVGSIRRLAKKGTRRRRLQDKDELAHGKRRDESRACVTAVLQRLSARIGPRATLVLRSDEKASYAAIIRSLFGDRATHETTSGRLARGKYNPLFSINTTLAMTRDNLGRLRRRSWLVTKQGPRLHDHLAIFTVYRNYMRRRFNYDQSHETPAMLLGLLPRQLHPHEVLAWRQDWGERSIHPMSKCASRTVSEAMPTSA